MAENLFSSSVFLAIASASLCDSKCNLPESGSPRKHCIGSRSWRRGRIGSLPQTKKNDDSAVARLGVIL